MEYLYGEAEKLIKDIYWAETNDVSNKLHIPNIIGERLVKENKDKDPEYYDHRPGVIHVSSMSKCLRGVVHEMLGTEKDVQDEQAVKRKLGVFKAGNLFEDFIVEALGGIMLDRQTEYVYKVKDGIFVTGRDDGTTEYEGVRRVLECKSVHSDSFWHREKAGELVAYQNQMQLQTYLYFRRILPNVFVRIDTEEIIYTNLTKQELWEYRGMRPDDKLVPVEKPNNEELNGIFTYISKDDCTIAQAPVKFNQRIIDEIVRPAIGHIIKGYEAKDPNVVPVPPIVKWEASRGQWVKNWLCTYCDFHCKCAGAGWVLEASAEVTRLNKEQSNKMANSFAVKPPAPTITVAPAPVITEPVTPGQIIGIDPAFADAEKTVIAVIKDGEKISETEILSPFPVQNTPIETDPHKAGETTLERMVRENKERLGQ